MKKAMLVLVLLMGILFSASPATTAASRPTSSEIQAGSSKTEASEAPPRWKKRKIQRQNTVGKTNRRAKRIQRKNGIGHTSPRSVSPQIGILTINPLTA